MDVDKKELKKLVLRLKTGLSSYYVAERGREAFFINIGAVSAGKINPGIVEKIRLRETEALERARLEEGDVVITAKGSSFRAAVATDAVQGYIISSNLMAFTLKEGILPELLVAYLNSPQGQHQLNSIAVGVAQKALNMRALMNLSIPVPSREKQKLLSKFLSILFEYEALIQRESELLSIIKNRIVENQMRG